MAIVQLTKPLIQLFFLMRTKLMKKVHRKFRENSSQCLKVLAQVTTEKTRMDQQRFDTFCQRKLTSESFDKGNKLTFTSVFAICSVFHFFFYKDQRSKDRTDFEADMESSFQSAPVLHWRAKPYSALSFDRVNFFSRVHLFLLSVMCYCFREPIQLSFLTPVK